MIFTAEIEKLRNSPIPVDVWKDIQVGKDNTGPYKQNYPNVAINERLVDPLVDVSRYGLVSSDFYMDQLIGGDNDLISLFNKRLLWTRAWLRTSHACRLARVDNYLRRNNLFLFVASGWRHPDLQTIITMNFAAKHGEEEARRMFAPVTAGKAPPPHSTGAAFDLEIWSLETGSRLEMYYKKDDKNIYNAYLMERMSTEASGMSVDTSFTTALMNRRILFHVLCTKGVVFDSEQETFCNHPGEFWHFGDGDPLSAYLSQQPTARYGLIYPLT
ncbi:MAG: hypothetical protein WC742_03545 [Gallionellaceae bacterium]|jgi:D-alanyl-D-alanine dipeptidase